MSKPTLTQAKSNQKTNSQKTNSTPKTHRFCNFDFRNTISVLVAIALVASISSLIYCVIDINRNPKTLTLLSDSDGNSANFEEGTIAEIASQVAPGVVSILTETRTTNFFGQASTSSAAGTGMIVSGDGYVLTNKHVIEGANSVSVILDDGTTYEKVEVVGTDPLNDIAFLKIKDVSDLPTVKLGDSKTINAGQQVIAIGNALGQFQNTVTAGVISGTGRSITAISSDYSDSEDLSDLIQTDAAINAGNSGGPLVNAAGEVIGINTATSSEADGIGFAIPVSSVKGMLKNLTKNGKVDRAYLGIYYVNITPDLAAAYELPVTSGAYIYGDGKNSAVIADGPAAKAGLKDEDIITKVNGASAGNAGTIASLIGEYMPGDTIQLTILRDGKEKTIDLTLEGYEAYINKQKATAKPQNS